MSRNLKKYIIKLLLFISVFLSFSIGTEALAEERSTIDVSVSVTWNDTVTTRPSQVQVFLYADGYKIDSKIITASDGWKATFTDLYEYQGGYEGNQDKKIKYLVDELDINNYSKEITRNNNSYTITNNHITAVSSGISEDVGKVIIPFTKKWVNVSNSEMPDAIVVNLYKYTNDFATTKTLIKTAVVSKDNNWYYEFDVSDESIFDSNNNVYKYAVVEENIAGFYEITSEHKDPNVIFEPSTLDDDWQRIEPCSELVISSSSDYKTVIVTKAKGGTYIIWTDVPLTQNERKLVFSLTSKINGMSGAKYEKTTFISGINGSYGGLTVTADKIIFNNPSNWALFGTGLYNKSSTETNASEITNTIDLVNVKVLKKWDDYNNIEGIRPNQVIVNLFANGEKIDSVSLSTNNNWSYTFTNLHKYSLGKLIDYSFTEETINGYQANIDVNGYDFTITNKHDVEKTQIKVSKNWVNVDGFNELPGVKVNLLKSTDNINWVVISTITLSKNNNWQYIFEKDANGNILPKSFYYKVEEVGYDVSTEEKSFYEESFLNQTKKISETEWKLTNTCKFTVDLPETGSSGMLILVLMGFILMLIPFVYRFTYYLKNEWGVSKR